MDIAFVATAFATAFTIIDPIGMIPMTLGATARDLPARRNQIVDQAVLVGAGVILFMGLVGRLLLGYLGITLPAFTIAGGVLLFLIAIDMLFARPTGAKRTEAEEREAAETENPAVFPARRADDRGSGNDRDGAAAGQLGAWRPSRVRHHRGGLRRCAVRNVALHAGLFVFDSRDRNDGNPRRQPASRHHPRRARRAVRPQRPRAHAAVVRR